MRVGTETRAWQEGRCLVFDDSWEHEATNPSDRSRSVLLVDIWHPDLTVQQRDELREAYADANAGGRQRGWLRPDREGAAGARHPGPIDPAIFGALDRERVARLAESARKARVLDHPFVAAAARRLLGCLFGAGTNESSMDWQAAAMIEDEAIWAELVELAEAADHDLRVSELLVVDLVLICSVSWRTWWGRAEAMTAFLDGWPPAEKAALADDLTALRTVQPMIRALASYQTPAGAPPFGALVPVVCAARSVISRSRPVATRQPRRAASADPAQTVAPSSRESNHGQILTTPRPAAAQWGCDRMTALHGASPRWRCRGRYG